MDPVLPILIFVGIAIAIGVGAYWSYLQAKKRREELSAWAKQKGWRFTADREYGVDNEFPDFSCLRNGENRYAYNVGRGPCGERYGLTFDYHYETHSTDSKGNRQTHHHHFSVVVLNSGLELERLDIRPENILDRIAEFAGFDDIDFESDEFSRTFHVKATDRRFAYDVIDQRMMEYLLEAPRHSISMSGPYLCVFNKKTWTIPQFEEALGLADGVIERLAPSLVRELKARA